MDNIVTAYLAWSFNQDRGEANLEDASEHAYHVCIVDIYGAFSVSILLLL